MSLEGEPAAIMAPEVLTPVWFPSIFSILKPGIGPSSSHTLGPALAARDFRRALEASGIPSGHLQVTLQGSLALTGKGHLTDQAVAAGLCGFDPEGDAPDGLHKTYETLRREDQIRLGARTFVFDPVRDILLDRTSSDLPHPNTMRFSLSDEAGASLKEETYCSIGGGRVRGGAIPPLPGTPEGGPAPSLQAALDHCLTESCDLVRLALDTERQHHGRNEADVYAQLALLWRIMSACIEAGLDAEGLLPGRLRLERRAAEMFEAYQKNIRHWRLLAPEITLATIYAIAAAEENASGGRIVTAPTCGSAGVLPAVLMVLKDRFHLPERAVCDGLLVAGFVGGIAAHNGSISGAEVGCQGEVGVAAAMAAAAACHLLEGTVPQVEFAAEVALEHHLGLTCDPVCGLVQVPCIERNAAGAVAALNAANLALLSLGRHLISFDQAVSALLAVGRDMSSKYKETALGGLAAFVREGP
jgi:L-serine dehydratase